MQNESTKVQNPWCKKTCSMLISEQTHSHMLCCFAGEVSTLSLELPEAEQLCILAMVASYESSRRYVQTRKHNVRSNNVIFCGVKIANHTDSHTMLDLCNKVISPPLF